MQVSPWKAYRRRPLLVHLGFFSLREGMTMKLAVLFTVNAILAVAFGIALALVPAELLALYGITLTAGPLAVIRLLGAAFIGLGVLSWLVRTAAPSEALRAIVVAQFIHNALAFLLSAYGVLSGATNALGWSTVAIYGLFAAGFASFAFRKVSGGDVGLHTTALTAK
jgi:hypothetical protein